METTVELYYHNNHGSMSKQKITFLKGAYDTIPFSQNEIDDLKCYNYCFPSYDDLIKYCDKISRRYNYDYWEED